MLDENGNSVEFAARLCDFGGPKGILVDVVVAPDFEPSTAHKHAAILSNTPVSFINSESLFANSDEFLLALKDWGYFGEPDRFPGSLRDIFAA